MSSKEKRKRKTWTARDVRFMRLYYPHCSTKNVAEALKASTASVYCKARGLGLKKSDRYMAGLMAVTKKRLAKLGESYRFAKGQEPFNKGLKLEEFMSKEGVQKVKKTWFRKGHTPANTRQVGSTRRDKDGYLLIKRASGEWALAHRALWEDHNGKVPEGYLVSFKNGNLNDIRLENLELIDARANMRRNSVIRYPAGAIRVFKRLKRLERLCNNRQGDGA